MNELNIQYHNKLNAIALDEFSAVEMDLFMAICMLMKDKGDTEQYIDLSEIRKVSEYRSTSKQRLEEDLLSVQKKLRHLNYANIKTDKFVGDVYLFSAFGKCTDREDTWLISVNKYATYILNHLTQEWTMFRLSEHNGLSSKYSKVLFRLLKQWRTVGQLTLTVEELRDILDISDSFSTSKIDERVLQPALKELSEYFTDLKIEKQYGHTPKGRRYLESYLFTFVPESTK